MSWVGWSWHSPCLEMKNFSWLNVFHLLTASGQFSVTSFCSTTHLPVVEGSLPVRENVLPTFRAPAGAIFLIQGPLKVIQWQIVSLQCQKRNGEEMVNIRNEKPLTSVGIWRRWLPPDNDKQWRKVFAAALPIFQPKKEKKLIFCCLQALFQLEIFEITTWSCT